MKKWRTELLKQQFHIKRCCKHGIEVCIFSPIHFLVLKSQLKETYINNPHF